MSTAKILAVDDEADFELSLSNASAARSAKEDSASASPITARKQLATLAVEADIDLTLLDFNMPVMDGLTLFARLREEQAPVKAIIVSAYGETPNFQTPLVVRYPLLRPSVSNRRRNSRDCRAA